MTGIERIVSRSGKTGLGRSANFADRTFSAVARTKNRTFSRDQRHVRLLNHRVRAQQQRLRDREAERLGGLEIDEQLELRGLLDRKIRGLGAL